MSYRQSVCNRVQLSIMNEFVVQDGRNKSESLAHLCDIVGKIENVLLEAIDFGLELVNWCDSGDFRAVCFSMAPAIGAAVAITVAFMVIPALVRAKPVLSLIKGAISGLRNCADGSHGDSSDSEFHFCVGSLFLIC